MVGFIHNFLKKPVVLLHDRLSPKQFLIISGILVGITSGLAAVALKYFVHFIGTSISFSSSNYVEYFAFALFPLDGNSLTSLFVKYVLKNPVRPGSNEIVFAIAKKSSVLPQREMYAHLATSALTVGFGGSMGLESPMVSTGSAIGSNYGKTYSLSYKDRTILLGCGAAAGIAAAFNSPIAGVLFSIEVLLTEIAAT